MLRIATAVTFTFLGLGVIPASAQVPPAQPRLVPAVFVTSSFDSPSGVLGRVGPAAVVDRLLSFDADGDERVTAAELPERMQSVLARLDQDGDGFLTAAEIEAGVKRQPVVRSSIALRNRGASSLTDVVDDLKLSPEKHGRAIEILKNYQVPRNLNNSRSIDLAAVHAAMQEVLDEEEFGNFTAAAARINPRNLVISGVVGGQPAR